MERSDSCGELYAALAAAQGAAQDALLDSTNPAFKSRYASLSAVIDRCRPVLAANGLALLMAPIRAEGMAGVEWTLGHKSGEWISGSVLYRLAQDTPQGAGSATTYARRYTYSAILGIAADDDDDGNAGSQPVRPQGPAKATSATPARSEAKRGPEPAQAAQRPAPGDQASTEQKRAIFASLTDRGLDAENREARRLLADEVLGIGQCESFARLTRDQARRILDAVGDGPDAWADMRLRHIWSRATKASAETGDVSLFAPTADDLFEAE